MACWLERKDRSSGQQDFSGNPRSRAYCTFHISSIMNLALSLLIELLLVIPGFVHGHPHPSSGHVISNSTTHIHPIKRLGWVAEPNCNRGTAGIVYSCLTTMLICTWTVQHVDIPTSSNGTRVWHPHFQLKTHKLRATLLTLIAPEITAFTAARDFIRARRISRLMKKYEIESWGPVHGSYAVMGGIRWNRGEEDVPLNSTAAIQEFLDSGGTPELRMVSERDIRDRDKGSCIVNTIACLQVVWFVIQLLCRRTQDLSSSILEITTTVFVEFSLLSFVLWWRKPQDVECYILLELPSAALKRKVHQVREASPGGCSFRTYLTRQSTARVLMISVFGSLHFLSWNANFPTP